MYRESERHNLYKIVGDAEGRARYTLSQVATPGGDGGDGAQRRTHNDGLRVIL